MNPAHIHDIITALKEDKSCSPKWRNKAVARLEEAIAFVEMGHRETNLKPPAGMVDMQEHGIKPGTSTLACTCPEGAVDKTCPVHGSSV